MRIRIIVNYVPRYQRGHEWNFVPPVTGIHLAALCGSEHDVEVVHEQVRQPPTDDWPELVALSFFSGFARRAYEVAGEYRRRGIRVVAGGPHVTYWVDEALEHVDAVVVGEADDVWPEVLSDFARGSPRRVYQGKPSAMKGLPTPRYDLLEESFVVPRVLQATRGCPFRCSFCSVPELNPGFRLRPIADVVRDVASSHFPHFWQEKVAWFWDDNLLVHRRWAKELLRELAGLDRWWLTQASIDIVKDRELLELMGRSGCIGIFLGIESLDADDLRSIHKRQNRAGAYREAIDRLHQQGICVMAGFISGLENHTPSSVVANAERLNAIGVDVPFLSILTPFRGTPLYDDLLAQDRILRDRDWPHYNGYNVAYRPARMSPDELLDAHRELWRRSFAPAAVAERVTRGLRYLSPGGLMLSGAMNGFYGLKRLKGNEPARATSSPSGRISHLEPVPVRLRTASAEHSPPSDAPFS